MFMEDLMEVHSFFENFRATAICYRRVMTHETRYTVLASLHLPIIAFLQRHDKMSKLKEMLDTENTITSYHEFKLNRVYTSSGTPAFSSVLDMHIRLAD